MRFLPRFLLVAGSVVAVACQQNTVANPALPLEAPASISSISLDSAILLVWAVGVNTPQSGFRFWSDLNGNGYGDPGELGLVQDGTRTDIDFSIYLQPSDSSLWIAPKFAGDSMQLYSTSPVADLTSIDFAPATGYTRSTIEAVPGYGYVFQRLEGGQFHYAALRVTAVSRQYVIFNWREQTDPGDPELLFLKGPGLT